VFLLSLTGQAQVSAPRNSRVSVEASAGSSHLVTAEITYVTFAFKGLMNYPRPTNIELEEADMFYSHASADRRNGQTIYYLHYRYQAVRKGVYEVPPITFVSEVGNIKSQKLWIYVYPKEVLTKKSADVGGEALTYYTLTKATKASLFPNETTHVEHKIYLPEHLRIALWGLPLGDKKNCSAWRFSTPNNRSQMSRARIDGKTFQAGSFHTNLTSHKVGKASIGPLKSRVVFHTAVMTRFGTMTKQFETHLVSDELAFSVKPLPLGQPEHFRGDVGSYVLSASIDTPREITANDSIRVIAQLKGTGNLATVNPPLLLNMEGWKIISQNRTDLGENRKSANGIAEFTYLLQPDVSDKIATQTPSLIFVALDPDTEKYRQSRIPSKPIIITAGKSTATDNGTTEDTEKPFNGLITSPNLGAYQIPWYKRTPIWLIHILPAGFILILGWRQLSRRIRSRRLANTERDLKRKALDDLEKVDSLFLKSAGAYIERWVDTDKHARAKEILSLRDSLCFRPDGRQDVSKERRKKIIAVLRKCSLVLLFTLLIPDSFASSAETFEKGKASYEQKNYTEAIATFNSLLGTPNSPDTLYNIGLSHQLNDESGMAAYHYLAALKLDKDHKSAQKNLKYVEQENDSITRAKLTDLETWIQILRPQTYLHITVFLVSLILCLILTLLYLKPRGTTFRLTIILCIFTPLILGLSIYGYLYHPDRSTYQLDSAVVIERANLTSQPLNSSQVVVEAPPASRCHIIAQRGSYTYVIMPNGIKGWVASDQIKTY